MLLSRQLLRQRPRLAHSISIYSTFGAHRFSASRSTRDAKNEEPKGRPAEPKSSWNGVAIGTGGLIAAASAIGAYQWRQLKEEGKVHQKQQQRQSISIPNLDKLGQSDEIIFSPPPTTAQVTEQLNEKAFAFPGTHGVNGYHGSQLASNSPCEDAYVHGSFSNPLDSKGSSWMAWAVFDGHCGWQLSDLLTRHLVPYVTRALADAKAKDGDTPPEASIQQALKTAFTTVDDALVKTATATIESDVSFADKARRLEAAYAGACALLTLFDPVTRDLRVASTGDCRAVLGQKAADGKWETQELTVDCTGANPDEAARIQAQFPDEPGIVKGGRVWGMQPSRTFGDGMWKWTSALKENLRWHYNGLNLPGGPRYKDYRDGPYLTAEPLVTTTRVPRDRPAFLILATDGLWDMMSSEQAVDLVGRWLDWQQNKVNKKEGPEEVTKEAKTKQTDFGPTVLGWKQQCRFEDKRATCQDENAAVHLVRNGLGGADDEMVRGALTFRYPNSRYIRDDVTVQVVFFSSSAKPREG
ncbi:protein phosphatase 2C-like domain-containing protein [Xylariomycetidae sp. FL2044]|nr:protein phosphatase 2C-like domain-containing protein [Xylariomycetidae sp. FL2044]